MQETLTTWFNYLFVMPIGEIADYFYRVEFQQRGSLHIHGLFWVRKAPQYEKRSNEEIVSFVVKYITCQKPDNSSDMEDLVNLQMHRHAKICKKAGHSICIFNFPLPPMPRTTILRPVVISAHIDRKTSLSCPYH